MSEHGLGMTMERQNLLKASSVELMLRHVCLCPEEIEHINNEEAEFFYLFIIILLCAVSYQDVVDHGSLHLPLPCSS